jgi:hypothetical protein
MGMNKTNISIVDQNGRTSTLSLTDKGIEVVGVLPHNSVIEIKSRQDALELINFISARYLSQRGTCPPPARLHQIVKQII